MLDAVEERLKRHDERLARLEEISKDKATVLLFECIEKGEGACVKQLLDEFEMTADFVDRTNRSALQFACRAGLPKEQQLLMAVNQRMRENSGHPL